MAAHTAFCSDYPSKNHRNCPSSVECFHAMFFINHLNRDNSTSNPDDVVAQSTRLGLERWYIEPGFAGFNSTTNNGDGYVTKDRAIAAVVRYQNKKG